MLRALLEITKENGPAQGKAHTVKTRRREKNMHFLLFSQHLAQGCWPVIGKNVEQIPLRKNWEESFKEEFGYFTRFSGPAKMHSSAQTVL